MIVKKLRVHELRGLLASGAFYLVVILLILESVLLFIWMATSSFKLEVDIYAIPPVWFFGPTLKHYFLVLQRSPFLQYFLNSFIVATGSAGLGLLFGLPAAYSIAKYGQYRWATAILASRIMPGVAYLLPLFLMFFKLGLIGTYRSLILSHLVVTYPMTVWIMIGFFEDIPKELIDAAVIDGCSNLGAFIRIVLPLTKPAVVTSGIIAFIYSWNDFKMALVLSDLDTKTLPVSVYRHLFFAQVDWGAMMANATLIIIPVLVLFFFVQKHIVKGLTMGGVKG